MLFLIVALCLLLPCAYVGGLTTAKRLNIDYKQRWKDALELLQDKAWEPIEPGPQWELDITYEKKSKASAYIYAYFWAVKGDQRIKIGELIDPFVHKTSFTQDTKDCQQTVDAMNNGVEIANA